VQHVVETPFPAIPLRFFFLGNMVAVSDEHGEMFRQDISRSEIRYTGKWSPNMLADRWWMLVWKTPTKECIRQNKTEGVSDVTFLKF
jgi:hypothetical protein